MIKILSTLLIIVFCFSGCATFQANPNVDVVLDEKASFTYSGRGAGAGVALMSTMGPAGIAVGVAIDEGIRKDLAESARGEGFDLERILENGSGISTFQANQVVIYEYGMKDILGTSGLMSPYVTYSLQSDEKIEFVLVGNSESELANRMYSLNEYRDNGSKIVEVFELLAKHLTQNN